MAAEKVKKEDTHENTPFTMPKNADNSKRYFEVKGFAWFSCPERHKRWPSAHSWCFLDLKEQEICYRDKQKCNKCNLSAKPEFQKESIKKMAKRAVKMLSQKNIGQHNTRVLLKNPLNPLKVDHMMLEIITAA